MRSAVTQIMMFDVLHYLTYVVICMALWLFSKFLLILTYGNFCTGIFVGFQAHRLNFWVLVFLVYCLAKWDGLVGHRQCYRAHQNFLHGVVSLFLTKDAVTVWRFSVVVRSAWTCWWRKLGWRQLLYTASMPLTGTWTWHCDALFSQPPQYHCLSFRTSTLTGRNLWSLPSSMMKLAFTQQLHLVHIFVNCGACNSVLATSAISLVWRH